MRLCYGLLVVLLAACGSDSTSSYDSGSNPPPPPGSPIVNVSMTDDGGLEPYAFSPAPLTVQVGTTVKWTNTGEVSHTSTSDAPLWDSGSVAPAGSTTCPPTDPYCTPGSTPAGTYTRTFDAVGEYQYHCEVHELQGMTGTITVTSP